MEKEYPVVAKDVDDDVREEPEVNEARGRHILWPRDADQDMRIPLDRVLEDGKE